MPRGHPAKRNEVVAKQVEALAGLGIPIKMIAKIVNVAHDVIARIYQNELDTGRSKACVKVAQRLFHLATSDDKSIPHSVQLNACQFWAKTQMGWREKSELEVSGSVNHQQIHVHFVGNGNTQSRVEEIRSEESSSANWQPAFIQ